MNRCIIYNYSNAITEKLSGYRLIPRVKQLEDIDTAAADATVEVKAGKTTVEFTLPAAAQWTEVSFDMPAKVKGLQDLSVALCNDAAVEIDWVTFK